MGLFNKLFGKKETENQPETSGNMSSHKDDWDVYFSHVDDIIGSFFIDLGLVKVAPLYDKPNLVWISVNMNSPREDGLSSSDEFETLLSLEDRLQEFLKREHNSIYVGRLTTGGRRDFYFYMGDTTLYDKTIAESMVAFPGYKFDFGIKEDMQWENYFNFMYPDPRQLQSIQNRRVVDNLQENGDPLTKERQVDHWIYFNIESDREKFLSTIKQEGFQVINQGFESERSDRRYSLHIARVDRVDIDSVNDYTLNLWALAEECNGNYDGWGTSIEKG